MKESIRRSWALLLVLVTVCAVCLLFSTRKEGMFIDEIYTFGLSNSSYAPFLRDVKGGSINHQVITRGELLDYVSVMGDEGFDFGSVYYNQVHDVHPPLYYWLFNIVSTLDKGNFSLWPGLILDGLLHLLSVVLLYALVRKLGGGRYNAAAAAILYGISAIGLSTMLMIRMYVLLTLLTLTLMLLIADLMARFRPGTCVLIGLTLLAGLMTQYYFVFYAFFLCAAYVFWALGKKQYKALAWFIPCALVGALALLAVFPAALDHLFSGKLVSGESAVENLKNFAQYPTRLRTFVGFARHGLKAAVYVALAGIGGICAVFPRLRKAWKEGRVRLEWLVFILPAFVTFVLVAVISPVDEPRYIYNIMPAFVLAVSFLLYLTEAALADRKGKEPLRALVFVAIALLALWAARSAPPDYLYPEYAQYDALIEEHRDAPCVYLSDDHFEPVTEDLLQLMLFDQFYVTDIRSFDGMLDYAGDADEIVLYIDISKFWSSGYDAEEVLRRLAAETPYQNAEPLFTTGLSTTYLITK